MILMVFSVTTMASSTSDPITRIKANMVRRLMENPRGMRKMKVPIKLTGMVMVGINVARQS